MLAFYSLYKAYRINPKDIAIKSSLNVLMVSNSKNVVHWYQIGVVAKYNITEAITYFSKHYFIYEKIDVLKQELLIGNLGQHLDFEEYCDIIKIGIEKGLNKI